MKELSYRPLERIAVPRPVARIPYIARQCAGRKVLDLGALDETAYAEKANTRFWLHRGIAEVAASVKGIDNSPMIPDGEEGLRTSANSRILKGDICDLARHVSEADGIEVIVAGELVEHMPDALSFFLGIREIGFLRGKTLLVTTPNATGLHNAILGLFSRESTHAGHLAVHSFKTLNTLCRKTMFESWDLVPYHVSFAEMILRSGGASKAAILCCEKVVDCFETLFPLLSGGWIVNIRI